MKPLGIVFAGALFLSASAPGQAPRATPSAETASPAKSQAEPDAAAPLPDLNTLMSTVEANERKAESIQKNYLYNESTRFDSLDSHGATKKTETREFEIFWINGIPIARTIAKDGKPLSADELKKENDKIDAEVKKARERRDKADAEGKETDPRGHDEITFARILELGAFSNERRADVGGRPTIVVDYTGDPKARTRNTAEGLFRELAGTVWIDEQDKTLQHVEGHFDHDFKVGAGLIASVKAGTWFKASFRKINDEVWLPASFEADGHARYLLFFSINGHITGKTGNYRRFKATTTILPGLQKLEPATEPPSALNPTPPPLR